MIEERSEWRGQYYYSTAGATSTGPALRKHEFLPFAPEALGPSLLGPRGQGQSPWLPGATEEGPRASGEGPRVVSGVVSGVVPRG